MFAVTHLEGGGGSQVDVRFTTPSLSEAIIKPSDPAQAGMWAVQATVPDMNNLASTPVTVTGDAALALAAASTVTNVTLSNGTLQVSCSDLTITTTGAGILDVTTGALAFDAPSTLDGLLLSGGGTVSGAVITATTKINLEAVATVENVLAGSAYLHVGDSDASEGRVSLLATNTYAGETTIERGALEAYEGVGVPSNSLIRFIQNNNDQAAVLQTSGTFTRNIGQGAGEVYWDNVGRRGGFSARGGDLTVNLHGGAAVHWKTGTPNFNQGNNAGAVQFESLTADSMVELVNDIVLDNSSGRVQVQDNVGTKADFVRFSGNISGGGTAYRWRFNENSGNNFHSTLVELLGTNTFTHETHPDDCTVYAIDGTGLPSGSLLRLDANSNAREAILLSNGTLTRDIGTGAGEVRWDNNGGGFAARGGKLTVDLEGGAQIVWNNGDTGFNNKWLMLNSQYADDVVEFVNDIDLNNSSKNIRVFDNTDTQMDYAVLSGNITGPNSGERLNIYGPGLLWLRGTNDYSKMTWQNGGVIRIDGPENLSPNSSLVFNQGDWTQPCILEAKGTLTNDVGPNNEAGAISWDQQHGGFAAFGGPLTVDLEGGGALSARGSNQQGFDDHWLQLGSYTANDVVTFENDIWVWENDFQVQLFDNTDSTADYAVMAGDLSFQGWGDFEIYGAGQLRLTGTSTIRNTEVREAAMVLFNGDYTGTDQIFTQDGDSGTIGGNGTVTVQNRFDIRSGGTLAPGVSAGTLTVSVSGGDGFRMYDQTTYEWELGPGGGDKVAVTGNLELRAGWTLKILSAGGVPNPATEYEIFTYTGTGNYNAPAIDISDIPADWDAGGMTVVHDDVGKRVYITGLYSPQGIVNDAESNVSPTSAQLNGWLSNSGEVMDVWAYWGEMDGGTNAGSWSNSLYVGSFTNVTGAALTQTATGLVASTSYAYTFRATNATYDLWAAPSESFLTVGPPIVANDGATAILAPNATLHGRFLDHNRGDVTLCWGLSDGGTASVNDWDYSMAIGAQADADFASVVNPVYYPQTYQFRCYATNAHGSDWSDAAAVFSVTTRPGTYPTSGLLGRWTFDDDTCDDSSGNTNHGVNAGGVYSSDVAPGAGGRSIDLNGDKYVTVDTGGNQDVFDVDEITVACWVKEWPDGDWDVYASKRGEGQGWKLRRRGNSGTEACLTLRGHGLDDEPRGVTTINADGLWHHLVGTYGDGYRRLYQDGSLIAEMPDDGPVNDTTNRLTFGAWDDNGTLKNFASAKLDDVVIYDRALTAVEISQLNEQIDISRRTAVNNALPTDATLTSITANGSLNLPDSVYDVRVYWGPTDGTNNPAAWATNAWVATLTNYAGTLGQTIAITPGATNYYTFRATNALDDIWAAPSMVVPPVVQPAVDNGAGAIVDIGSATLQGNLTAGGYADISVYWGRSDGGTNASSWDGVVALADLPEGAFDTDVAAGYGETYFYRCYATNSAGDVWAGSTTNFSTIEPQQSPLGLPYLYGDGLRGSLFIPTPDTQVPLDLAGANYEASFTRIFTGDKADTVLAMTEATGYNIEFTGPVACANNNDWGPFPTLSYDWDHFATAYSGRFFPEAPGSYNFRFNCDDRAWMWIDMDDNGTFESGEEVGIWDWYCEGQKTLDRTNGYNFVAMAHEFGGGRTLNWWVTPPGGAEVTVSAGVQAGVGIWRNPTNDAYELSLANMPVTAVWTNSATMNGVLSADGWVFDVYACWGTNDGGTAVGNWESSVMIGSATNYGGPLTHDITGLARGADYFCTFIATNAVTNLPAIPSVAFQTMDEPTITNLPPTDVMASSARLNGEFRGGSGDVTIYWGLSDGGGSHGAWGNTNALGTTLAGPLFADVSLLAGGQYFYRCYVTNALGEDWADTTETFASTLADITVTDVAMAEGDTGQTNMLFDVALSDVSASNVMVNFATADGSATAGVDYTATNGTLTIASGTTVVQIAVSISGDRLGEYPSEVFRVDLSSPVNAAIADGMADGVIIDDDFDVSLASWIGKMKITFDGYTGSETLTNFPALVVLSEAIGDFQYSHFASPEGLDLRFSDAQQQELNYEIEHWDTTGNSYVWVQVPELAPSNTAIWAYWGNEDATDAPSYTTDGSTWSQDYVGVWHLDDTNALGQLPDSASTNVGVNSGTVNIAGKIGDAQDFENALTNQIEIANEANFDLPMDITVSTWIKVESFTTAWQGIVAKGEGAVWRLHRWAGNDGVAWTPNLPDESIGGTNSVNDTSWHFVAGTRDASNATLYVDGVLDGVVAATGLPRGENNTQVLIGNNPDQAARWFDGIIDETRISSVARSADWLMATWLNQSQTGQFSTYGPVIAPKGMLIIVR